MQAYEVRIKEYECGINWEDLKPTLVFFSTNNWFDALESYITYLKENDVDLSKVWEYRINYAGSSQGHYYNVGYEKLLSGEWK